MAEQGTEERIEIPFVLENVLRYCLKDARERMEAGESIAPFSALAAGETLFMEEHPFDSPEECFDDARHTVENARGAAAYGFCYDGFVETALGNRDALIAQGGVPGDEDGHAIGLLYTIDDEDNPHFEDEPIYVAKCSNFMAGLSDDDAYEAEVPSDIPEEDGEGAEDEEEDGEGADV